MPPLALFASKNLKIHRIVNLGEKKNTLSESISAEKVQLNINYEVILDLSPELIDLWFIHKHFINKFASKYIVRDIKPVDVTDR